MAWQPDCSCLIMHLDTKREQMMPSLLANSQKIQNWAGHMQRMAQKCARQCFPMDQFKISISLPTTRHFPDGSRAWNRSSVNVVSGQPRVLATSLCNAKILNAKKVQPPAAAEEFYSHSRTLSIKSLSLKSILSCMAIFATSTQNFIVN